MLQQHCGPGSSDFATQTCGSCRFRGAPPASTDRYHRRQIDDGGGKRLEQFDCSNCSRPGSLTLAQDPVLLGIPAGSFWVNRLSFIALAPRIIPSS